eukprot:8383260-Alexandrium_andersonii.AAC.1
MAGFPSSSCRAPDPKAEPLAPIALPSSILGSRPVGACDTRGPLPRRTPGLLTQDEEGALNAEVSMQSSGSSRCGALKET